ncbi:uncharacterized protein LOC142761680 isoform X2 [Rhipicephalus microplus]|uniref:uncharacterized protein LOC142761680 isoform X2 n=1 Tax=Rhipicephalus microplus TaxID=6941 RepID=UPI003F6AF639
MTSPSAQSADISIITRPYISHLQNLCVASKPSIRDVTSIFEEFHRSLDARKPNPSQKPPSFSSTSSSASKKRRGKTVARAKAGSDDADGHSGGSLHSDVCFERPCTWEPNEKPCWILSDVELWNGILAGSCIELSEYMWGELVLEGYEWPEKKPAMQDVLRASLLIHVLLKQHRCVTEVSLDHYITVVEKYVLLDALKTGAEGVKRLVYKQAAIDIICQADDKGAGIFLDHLSRNRSLKTLHLQEHFLLERKGRALADAIRNHATLEELKVKGSKDESPSALLIAAAQSRSLRSLILLESFIDAAHIKVMASALTIPSLPAEFEALTVRRPPMSRLQKLSLSSCKPFHSDMEAAYAKLIGGALVELTLSDCGLGEVFASHASERLLHDRRLNLLNVETNLFSVNSLQSMIKSLETNKTLKTLVVSLTTAHSEEDISPLFETMRQVNAFSRMWLHWKNPWPSDLANSLLTARTLSVSIKLDDYKEVDAAVTLGAIARHRSFDAAEIECSKKVEPAVLHILADALARTKSLQKVPFISRHHIIILISSSTNLFNVTIST